MISQEPSTPMYLRRFFQWRYEISLWNKGSGETQAQTAKLQELGSGEKLG